MPACEQVLPACARDRDTATFCAPRNGHASSDQHAGAVTFDITGTHSGSDFRSNACEEPTRTKDPLVRNGRRWDRAVQVDGTGPNLPIS